MKKFRKPSIAGRLRDAGESMGAARAYVAKAPEEVLAEQREKRAEAGALAARLGDAIGRLQN